MSLSRRKFGIACAGMLVGCTTPASQDLALSDVIERHTRARGGERAIDSIRMLRNASDIVEPTFAVLGGYLASKSGLVRVDVYSQGRHVFSEGIDSAGAWSLPDVSRPPETESEGGARALRHGLEFNLYGLHAFTSRGHSLSLVGRETVEAVSYYVVRVVLNDGFETYRYIDPNSWMVVRSRDVRALHVDVDPTENRMETVFSDFRSVEGVMMACASVNRNLTTNDIVQRVTARLNVVNPQVSESAFARAAPAQVYS